MRLDIAFTLLVYYFAFQTNHKGSLHLKKSVTFVLHFKLFVQYSNFLNSLDRSALFGICIWSIFKTQIYSVFGIQYSVYFHISNIFGVLGIRSKLSFRPNTALPLV